MAAETKPSAPPRGGSCVQTVPGPACRFDRAGLQFADNPPAEGELPRGKFSMMARTGNAIMHWYWGQIIHDMAGFTPRKDKISVDYCHDWDVLGYADKQTAAPEGLTMAGELIAFKADDRAAEVLFKGAAGVPYEASIDWDYSRLEFIEQGVTVEVNGQQFIGPGYVVRDWTCYSVAVCPYGADSDTVTEFSKASPKRPTTVEVTLFSAAKGTSVTTPTPPAPPAEPKPEVTREQFAAELKKFTDKFGAENGTKWFAEGKTWEQGLELHIAAQETKFSELQKKHDDLATKLKSVPRGEENPVSHGDQGTGESGKKLTALQKLAQKVKLPAKS